MAREVTAGLLVGLLELVKLAPLMRLTQGRPEIAIGLIDGPVNIGHPGFGTARFREVAGKPARQHRSSREQLRCCCPCSRWHRRRNCAR
jgi:hypothetical protein